MVEKGTKIEHLTDEQKVGLLRDIIGNSNDHNAFYIAKRSCYRELLEIVINRNDNSPSENWQSTDNLLAKAYEELMLKGVPLTKDMEFFVEEKLINLRFFIERNDQNVKKFEPSVENVKKRIETLCDQINQLKKEYLGETGKEVDGEFILIAIFVAQNIHILKRQLKSTYDKLPWEEMEFCVVIFVSSHTKHQELNVVYKRILDKARLLNHLTNFEEALNKPYLTIDVNSSFRRKSYKDLSERNSAIKVVIERNSSFQELLNDYEILKNVYSLKRIESYVELASSINLDKETKIGILAIERTLQVIGESLKNTLVSPNVSDEIHKMLLDSAPRNLRETITSLRDLLSHSHTLTKKVKLEDEQNLTFFRAIRDDIRKVGVDIGDILYKKKADAIRVFLNKIISCNDLQEVKKLADSLTGAELGELKLEDSITKVLVKTMNMIDELSDLIKDKTEKEQGLFDRIKEIISLQKIKLIKFKLSYVSGLSNIKLIINQINNNNDLISIQIKCQNLLNATNIPISTEERQDIVYLANEIINSVTPRKQESELHKIRELYENISIIEPESRMIQEINKLKVILQEKVNIQDVIEKVEVIFSDITMKIKVEQDKIYFLQKVSKEKNAYQAKQELKTLFSESNEEPKKYDNLVGLLGLKKKKKKNLDEVLKADTLDKCQEVLDSVQNAYQNLLKSVRNSINDKKSDDLSLHFKVFVNSIIKKKLLADVLNNAIDITFRERKEQLRTRLKTLKLLVDGKNFAKKFRQDIKMQAAVEMVILDITEILDRDGLFGDYQLFFDSYSPILIGKTLRNYLAHGNPLIDTLPFEPSTAILANALKLAAEEETSLTKISILIGQIVREDTANLANRYVQSLKFIKIQNEMFTAAKLGNLENVKDRLKAGADFSAKDIKGRTGLDFAGEGGHEKVIEFFLDQNIYVDKGRY